MWVLEADLDAGAMRDGRSAIGSIGKYDLEQEGWMVEWPPGWTAEEWLSRLILGRGDMMSAIV